MRVSAMQDNPLRKKWDEDGCGLVTMISNPGTVQAELLQRLGFDAVIIDMQHGAIGLADLIHVTTAISGIGGVPLVRVPGHERGLIGRVLDIGVYGVVCPTVETAGEARALVDACRYAPAGSRSFGPLRAVVHGGADYYQHANDSVLVIAMIETGRGLENVDEIAATPGIDGLFIGPSDLAISLGRSPRVADDDTDARDAHARIIAAAHAHGAVAGIHAGTDRHIEAALEAGADFISVGTDHMFVVAGAQARLDAARALATK